VCLFLHLQPAKYQKKKYYRSGRKNKKVTKFNKRYLTVNMVGCWETI